MALSTEIPMVLQAKDLSAFNNLGSSKLLTEPRTSQYQGKQCMDIPLSATSAVGPYTVICPTDGQVLEKLQRWKITIATTGTNAPQLLRSKNNLFRTFKFYTRRATTTRAIELHTSKDDYNNHCWTLRENLSATAIAIKTNEDYGSELNVSSTAMASGNVMEIEYYFNPFTSLTLSGQFAGSEQILDFTKAQYYFEFSLSSMQDVITSSDTTGQTCTVSIVPEWKLMHLTPRHPLKLEAELGNSAAITRMILSEYREGNVQNINFDTSVTCPLPIQGIVYSIKLRTFKDTASVVDVYGRQELCNTIDKFDLYLGKENVHFNYNKSLSFVKKEQKRAMLELAGMNFKQEKELAYFDMKVFGADAGDDKLMFYVPLSLFSSMSGFNGSSAEKYFRTQIHLDAAPGADIVVRTAFLFQDILTRDTSGELSWASGLYTL